MMKHFIRLTDYTKEELLSVFAVADSLKRVSIKISCVEKQS